MAKQKILYCFFKTGGGHFFSAKALARAVEQTYPDTESILVDGLPDGPSFWRTFLEDGYRFAVQDWPFLWPLLYNISRLRPVRFFQLLNIDNICSRHLQEQILRHQPTRIVVLHFLLVRPVVKAVRRLGLDIPVREVVTDPFTVHPFWWHHRNVPAAVFSERARNDAIKHGWKPEYLTVFPIMLRPEFSGPLPPEQISQKRQQFNLGNDKPVILLAGGGDGLPDADKLLAECDRLGLDARFLVVCGKNEKLRAVVQKLVDQNPRLTERTQVFGFVDFMFDLMNMADIIVTKGGPATIMEILLIGKPPLVINYIYGQEQGNVDFLLEHRIGTYIPSPRKMALELKKLLDNPAELTAMVDRIRKLNLTNGTPEVARWVIESRDPKS